MKFLNIYKNKITFSIISVLLLPVFVSAVTIKNPLGSGVNSITDLLDKILNLLFVIAAPIITIMTLYAAYLIMTSGGEETKLNEGKRTLLYIVIGVVVMLLSKAMVGLINSFLQ